MLKYIKKCFLTIVKNCEIMLKIFLLKFVKNFGKCGQTTICPPQKILYNTYSQILTIFNPKHYSKN